jgi:hypothetical protein
MEILVGLSETRYLQEVREEKRVQGEEQSVDCLQYAFRCGKIRDDYVERKFHLLHEGPLMDSIFDIYCSWTDSQPYYLYLEM